MLTDLTAIDWIFFDVGSTLVDETACLQARFATAAAAASRLNVSVCPDDLWRWCADAYAAFSASPFRAALARTRLTHEQQEQVYRASPYESAGETPYAGVARLLEQLSSDHRLGIIANQGPGLPDRLAAHGVGRHFSCVLGSGDVGVGKPAPGIFELAAEQAGSAPGRMLMVGDRLDNDIRPANELGWHTVRVRQGIARGQEPRDPQDTPELEIESVVELVDVLGL